MTHKTESIVYFIITVLLGIAVSILLVQSM